MSLPTEQQELIDRLAEAESQALGQADSADPTLAAFKAELETLESEVRRPPPPDPFSEEPEFQQALGRLVELSRDPANAGAKASEPKPENAAPPLGNLGHYKLLAKLGEGGMGAVYKAVHTTSFLNASWSAESASGPDDFRTRRPSVGFDAARCGPWGNWNIRTSSPLTMPARSTARTTW